MPKEDPENNHITPTHTNRGQARGGGRGGGGKSICHAAQMFP